MLQRWGFKSNRRPKRQLLVLVGESMHRNVQSLDLRMEKRL
jgi:hypothetical protein